MGVHDGHRERRRALFRRCGEDAFADHELLEVLLFYAIPRKDTNPIAHALIDQFGSLQAVLAASPEELESVPEVGPSASTLIALVSALSRKALTSAASGEVVLDTRARVGDFFVKLLASESKEVLYQLTTTPAAWRSPPRTTRLPPAGLWTRWRKSACAWRTISSWQTTIISPCGNPA